MAALSSTCFSLLAPNNITPLHAVTFPSNSKTHLAFPPSNSKILNFSLKSQKKDSLSNDSTEESEVKNNEPNRKKEYKERKKIKIDSTFFDEEAAQINRTKMDKKIKALRLRWKQNKNDKKSAELLEKLEKLCEALEPLDLIKLRDSFDYDTFSVIKIERDENSGLFFGNLRVPIDQALPVLEKKLSEAAGNPVDISFSRVYRGLEAVTVVQKSQTDLVYELTKQSTPAGYAIAAALSVTTLGTTAWMSGFFLKTNATIDYYLADVVPLFGGFLTILGVSEIATRVTAARYGVKLGPTLLVPSIWTGCLGMSNNCESRIPNMKALFDISVARTASAYLTSILFIVTAFVSDGSLNGGDHPLYIKPDFFSNNPLISLIQFIIGDDRIPYDVEGVGVTVDPLAFAGLLGMLVTSLNLLPCGQLEGRYIVDAMFGTVVCGIVSFATHFIILVIGATSGSPLFLGWGLFTIVYQPRCELFVKDGITPLGEGRYALGLILGLICYLTLFPNAAGTFSTWSLTEPYFRGFV